MYKHKKDMNIKRYKVIYGICILLSSMNLLAQGFSTTSTDDVTAPVISNLVGSDIQGDKMFVIWTTDEIADGQVLFNQTGSTEVKVLGNIQSTLQHTIVLTKLSPTTAYEITVKSTDTSGNQSTASLNVSTTVNTNAAPTLSGSPTTNTIIYNAYSFAPSSNDAEGETLTFSISNKPSWASFDTATGDLTGTPALADINTYTNIVISVTDGTNTTNLSSFSIIVSNTSTTDNGDGTLTLTASFLDSNATLLNNTLITDSTSTITTTASGKVAENTIGSSNQKVSLLDNGSVVLTLDTQNSTQIASITSNLTDSDSTMLDTGEIQLSAGNMSAQLKNDGSLLLSVTVTDTSGTKTTTISVANPNADLTINQDASSTITIVYLSNVPNSSGQIITVETVSYITTSANGSVTIQSTQVDPDDATNRELPTFISSQILGAGIAVIVSGDKILFNNATDSQIVF